MKQKLFSIVAFMAMFYCAWALAASGSITVGAGGTTLPDQSGNVGKVLTTDGTILSWADPSGTGSFASRALDNVTGFTSTRVPFLSSSTTFGDSANLTYDSTNKILYSGPAASIGNNSPTRGTGGFYSVEPSLTPSTYDSGFFSESAANSSANFGGNFIGRRMTNRTGNGVAANDTLVNFGGSGWDTVSYSLTAAGMRARALSTWSATDHQAEAGLYATAAASTTLKLAASFSTDATNGGGISLVNFAQTAGQIRRWNGSSQYTLIEPASQGGANTCERNDGSGNLTWVGFISTLGGDVTSSAFGTGVANTVTKIQGVAVDATPPTDTYVLTYNSAATQWEPRAASGGGGSPGGPTTAIQFNNSGSFGGTAQGTGGNGINFTYDGAATVKFNSGAPQGVGFPIFEVGDSGAGATNIRLMGRQNLNAAAGYAPALVWTHGTNNDLGAVATADSGSSSTADIAFMTGAAGGGDSGNLLFQPGTASGTVGKIKLDDRSGTITAGQVWTATASNGAGHWGSATPQGTLCGWYDVATSSDRTTCKGASANGACPAGYTQVDIPAVAPTTKVCAAN